MANDVETGVTTQGETREAALADLDDALQLYHGESGQPPTDNKLESMEIDPATNTTGEQRPPDPLK